MSILIESPVLGSLDVTQDDIYLFPSGIPGFEDQKRFIIVQPEANAPFAYLQSMDHADLVLLVTDPFAFYPDYDFEVPEQVIGELEIEASEEVGTWAVVTVPQSMEAATMNLLAPILLNVRSRKGRQTILTNTSYSTKHPMFPFGQASGDNL